MVPPPAPGNAPGNSGTLGSQMRAAPQARPTRGEKPMRKLLAVAFSACAALVAGGALAQPYPAKPVKLIVTYPPGGSSDLLARVFGQKLSEIWGQPVIVESKPGAAGSIGVDYTSNQNKNRLSLHRPNNGPAAGHPHPQQLRIRTSVHFTT